ncbi:uncharacterized [Tachysurus ichikawai]
MQKLREERRFSGLYLALLVPQRPAVTADICCLCVGFENELRSVGTRGTQRYAAGGAAQDKRQRPSVSYIGYESPEMRGGSGW